MLRYSSICPESPASSLIGIRILPSGLVSDRGNVERLVRGRNIGGLGTERERPLIGLLRIDHAKRHRRCARTVRRDEAMAVGAGLLVDEVIDVALAIDRDLLALVPGDRRIA